MRHFIILLVGAGILLAGTARALTFSVSPMPQTVSSGSPVSVDVVVSDFSDIAGY